MKPSLYKKADISRSCSTSTSKIILFFVKQLLFGSILTLVLLLVRIVFERIREAHSYIFLYSQCIGSYSYLFFIS